MTPGESDTGGVFFSVVKRLRGVLLFLILLAVGLVVTWRPLLTAAGAFLIVQDPEEKADVIIVLSGGRKDERVRQGAELYRQGYAPKVLLSGGDELEGIAVPDLLRQQALHHGIPDSALLFESRSTSTAEQARFLRPLLEQHGFTRAIVVTSNFHTRRTRYLFRRVFAGSTVKPRVYPVQNDFFSPVKWWTRDWDTEEVVLEYIKLGLSFLRYH
jgi:uncharacterized SAM-binding protein YcdF (DUF218 family)